MRRMLVVAFSALALSFSASATAQTTRRVQDVAPSPSVAAIPIPGASVLDGSWSVVPLTPGILTLSTGANGVLTGTFVSGAINVACGGQHHGLGFFITCDIPGTPVVFTGNAELEEPVATQRRAAGAQVRQLSGRTFLAQRTAQGMSVIESVFLAYPA